MSKIGRTLLVTGGAGFIGSHFARAAAEQGRRVVVVDDLSGGERPRLPDSIAVVVGEVGNRDLLLSMFAKFEIGTVVHFAGKIQVGESVKMPGLYFHSNLVHTLTLLEAMRTAGLSRFLFSSTAAVYGTPEGVPIVESARLAPESPYGASKLAVEHLLAGWHNAYQLSWCALRYFNAAGAHPDGTLRECHRPETHLIPLALDAGLGQGPPLQLFGDDYDTLDGTCIRDYIHVQDLCTAHLAAVSLLERGVTLGPLNLGIGRGYSVREVIHTAGLALGRPVPHEVGPRRAGDPPQLIADSTLARKRLEWQPRRTELGVMIEDALRSRLVR